MAHAFTTHFKPLVQNLGYQPHHRATHRNILTGINHTVFHEELPIWWYAVPNSVAHSDSLVEWLHQSTFLENLIFSISFLYMFLHILCKIELHAYLLYMKDFINSFTYNAVFYRVFK
ncbi:hypothetical protein L9F63_009735, partial [Diploptera punctata]